MDPPKLFEEVLAPSLLRPRREMSEAAQKPKLTKKEKKAQAFRANKGKGKKDESQPDVPDSENLDDDDAAGDDDGEGTVAKKEKKTKKRPREEGDEEEGKEADEVVEADGERKKKRQRGKKKSQQLGPREDGKPRLLLFVGKSFVAHAVGLFLGGGARLTWIPRAGNLPYKVTVEAIQAHFGACGASPTFYFPPAPNLTWLTAPGEVPTVRLLTPKPSPTATVAKSKGCAFLEFQLPIALQAALRLHESDLAGRKINVELTAGGGGNSAARKAKLDESRKRLLTEREKTIANRKKREGEDDATKDKSARWGKKGPPKPVLPGEGLTAAMKASAAPVEGVSGEAEKPKTQIKIVNGKKVRDRRIPKVTEGVEKERARKVAAKAAAASSGANSVKLGA